jgi:hypothetical protein
VHQKLIGRRGDRAETPEELADMIWGRGLILSLALLAGSVPTSFAASGAAPDTGSVGKFELHADTSMPARTISFGQVFLPGTVQRSDHLQVILDGHAVPTQADPKAFNGDGSIRHAILTVEVPKLRSGQKLNGSIVKQAGDAAPDAPAAAVPMPPLDVIVGLKGANGAVNAIDVNLPAIAQNPRNVVSGSWIKGPLAEERRFMADVSDHLQILFDVFMPQNGPARVDVIFHNDWTGIHHDDNLDYDVEMRLAGAAVYQARGVHHYTFATWHHLLWADGKPSVRIVPDLAGLEAAAAVPRYDPDFDIGGDITGEVSQSASKLGDAPMSNGTVDKHMPDTGGRMDIGPMPTWAVVDLRNGEEDSRKLLLANADAAGTVPWHLRDRKTGQPLSIDAHPNLWLDSRGGETVQGVLPEAFSEDSHGWTIDDAHEPALTYLPYLLTGSQYYRDELSAQAAYVLLAYDPNFRGMSHGLIIGEHGDAWQQVRGLSWSLRTIANAAFILPANDPMRGYYDAKLKANLAKLVQLYVQDRSMKSAGALEGWMPGNYRPDGATAPWQQSFLAVVLSWTNDMGYSDAGRVVGWMSNFLTGLFTSADQGFDPMRGAAYILQVYDPNSGQRFNSWGDAFKKSSLGDMSGKDINDAWNAYGMIMRAGTGAALSVTHTPRAEQAYQFALAHSSRLSFRYAAGDPTFAILPKPAPVAAGARLN